MNLRERIMEFITNEWITSKELAEIIAKKYPEEFKSGPYNEDTSSLSMALGPSLYAMANRGILEHDGTKWPAIKRWRRIQPKGPVPVDDAAEALILFNLAKDKYQAIRMLAERTIRENESEFKELIKEASRISEESMKIGKKMLGISK